jgi:UDP-2,3-diacylglucosamine pyrophosphatase LpxH
MSTNRIFRRLDSLLKKSSGIEISDRDRLVIMSDFHMGDGGSLDDFKHNSDLMTHILKNHYRIKKYSLVLNGDIEEIQRYSLKKITEKWSHIYEIFKDFHQDNRLIKIFGNHDYELRYRQRLPGKIPVSEGLVIGYKKHQLMLFHGHQAHLYPEIFLRLSTIILRLVANPLRIKNYAVALDNQKKYRIEKRVYQYARLKKMIVFMGHTHRPLFESLAKVDRMKFEIENLCRRYPVAPPGEKPKLEQKIVSLKDDLRRILKTGRNRFQGKTYSLYDSEPLVPCIFNSGSAIGKRGVTALEIAEGKINLVYWFDRRIPQKSIEFNEYPARQLDDSEYFRMVLKTEDLDYLLTRVRLLS